MSTPSITAQLDATIKAVQSGLTHLAAEQGAKHVTAWMTALDHADFRGAKVIHDNLGKLKRHLEADTLDGPAIGELLRTLSAETARVASHVEGAAGEKVKHLGELLGKAAGDLRQ